MAGYFLQNFSTVLIEVFSYENANFKKITRLEICSYKKNLSTKSSINKLSEALLYKKNSLHRRAFYKKLYESLKQKFISV